MHLHRTQKQKKTLATKKKPYKKCPSNQKVPNEGQQQPAGQDPDQDADIGLGSFSMGVMTYRVYAILPVLMLVRELQCAGRSATKQ